MSEFARFQAGDEESHGFAELEGLTIRAATEDDLDEIAEIAASREGEPLEKWQRSVRRSFESSASGEACLLVASFPSGLAGYGKAGRFVPPESSPSNVAPEGWYLTGLVVRPACRRQGIGSRLTVARLEWIANRADRAFYFANARNEVSIALHNKIGFVEVTRDFHHPQVSFEGGAGVLFVCPLGEFA